MFSINYSRLSETPELSLGIKIEAEGIIESSIFYAEEIEVKTEDDD